MWHRYLIQATVRYHHNIMLTILQNQSFTLVPAVEARDTGWVLSAGLATHYPCNPGTMFTNNSEGLIVGHSYVVTYEVINLVSGSVRVQLGSTPGTSRTTNGIYTETIVCSGTAKIGFYSDGYLTIRDNFSYYELVDVVDNSITVAFYEGEGADKKWATYYAYAPEMMIRFSNKFFTIKNGALWLQNSNETRNNFYGVQSVSKIKLFDNINPTTVKEYYSMRAEANTPWYCPGSGDIVIYPVSGLSSGMTSRLRRGNFRNYQGSFYANFMRNYLDARFENPEDALFQGGVLRGRIMEINVTNADTTPAVLFEIDIKSSPSSITY